MTSGLTGGSALIHVFITNLRFEVETINKKIPKPNLKVESENRIQQQTKTRGKSYKKRRTSTTRIACRGSRLVRVTGLEQIN